MANTYTLIASNTLGASAASVTFSAIPATFTDLVLRISARASGNTGALIMRFNGASTNYSETYLQGNGSSASSARESSATELKQYSGVVRSTYTADTFSSAEIYIPSYTANQNKPSATFATTENNNATSFINAFANLWSDTSTINSIAFTLGGGFDFVSGSSFFLYGIKNS